MPKNTKRTRLWILIAVLGLVGIGAMNLAIAKSTLSLNSPASFPVDI